MHPNCGSVAKCLPRASPLLSGRPLPIFSLALASEDGKPCHVCTVPCYGRASQYRQPSLKGGGISPGRLLWDAISRLMSTEMWFPVAAGVCANALISAFMM